MANRSKARYPEDSFMTPSQFLSLSSPAAFYRLITQKEKYGQHWLIQQLERLHKDPQVLVKLSVLDRQSSLNEMCGLLCVYCRSKDIKTHLEHINAASHGIISRMEADAFRKQAEANLNLLQKLKRNIRKTLDK